MPKKCHQLTLSELFVECRDIFESKPPKFFELLDENIDIGEFIPARFHFAFHKHFGRKRDYPLEGFLSSLILQKIIKIPTDSLLIVLLIICREFREFCGFTKVPDAPLFTRFKQDFLPYIEEIFQKMVDYTEPICQAIDPVLSNMLAFDTTGIELFVKENNPKTLNSLIKKLKSYYKNIPDVDPHKMAYGLMPSQAESCSDAKQHMCSAPNKPCNSKSRRYVKKHLH